jgi:AcrR family transcriptional regulator
MSVVAPPRGEQTREDILAAAHRLFLESGYHGASMRQIAQEAGIALGGIYNHFESKEEIFVTVLLHHHPVFAILPAMTQAHGETVAEIVRDAAARMVSNFGDRMDFLNLMFIELVEFKGQHVPQLFQLVFPQVLEFSSRALEGRSELRPIPTPMVVRAFIGMFFAYMITELLIGRQLPAELSDGSLDYMVDIFLNGILEPSASARIINTEGT